MPSSFPEAEECLMHQLFLVFKVAEGVHACSNFQLSEECVRQRKANDPWLIMGVNPCELIALRLPDAFCNWRNQVELHHSLFNFRNASTIARNRHEVSNLWNRLHLLLHLLTRNLWNILVATVHIFRFCKFIINNSHFIWLNITISPTPTQKSVRPF